jgi:hypothetical protein
MTLPWPSVSPPDSAPGYGGRSQNESTPTAKAACGSAARGVGVLSELGLPVRSLKSFRIDSGFSETVPKGPLKWQLAHNSNEWSRSPGPLLWLQRSPLRAEHTSVRRGRRGDCPWRPRSADRPGPVSGVRGCAVARWVRAAASLFELQCLACDTERSERRRMTALAVKFSKTS